jgi:hypothetical protein
MDDETGDERSSAELETWRVHDADGLLLNLKVRYRADGGYMTPDDGLDRWIGDLRDRLARGDLAGLGPIELGHGTRRLSGETTVRCMLADLADLEDPAGSAANDPAWRRERLCGLREDFRRLRELLG